MGDVKRYTILKRHVVENDEPGLGRFGGTVTASARRKHRSSLAFVGGATPLPGGTIAARETVVAPVGGSLRPAQSLSRITSPELKRFLHTCTAVGGGELWVFGGIGSVPAGPHRYPLSRSRACNCFGYLKGLVIISPTDGGLQSESTPSQHSSHSISHSTSKSLEDHGKERTASAAVSNWGIDSESSTRTEAVLNEGTREEKTSARQVALYSECSCAHETTGACLRGSPACLIPMQRAGHSAVWTDNGLLIFGGWTCCELPEEVDHCVDTEAFSKGSSRVGNDNSDKADHTDESSKQGSTVVRDTESRHSAKYPSANDVVVGHRFVGRSNNRNSNNSINKINNDCSCRTVTSSSHNKISGDINTDDNESCSGYNDSNHSISNSATVDEPCLNRRTSSRLPTLRVEPIPKGKQTLVVDDDSDPPPTTARRCTNRSPSANPTSLHGSQHTSSQRRRFIQRDTLTSHLACVTRRHEVVCLPIVSGTAGSGPCPRAYHAAAYRRAQQQMIICGGTGKEQSVLSDLWVLDLSKQSWDLLTPLGEGPQVTGHTAVLVDSDAALFVCGGSGVRPGPCALAMFDFASARWRTVQRGESWAHRVLHCCVTAAPEPVLWKRSGSGIKHTECHLNHRTTTGSSSVGPRHADGSFQDCKSQNTCPQNVNILQNSARCGCKPSLAAHVLAAQAVHHGTADRTGLAGNRGHDAVSDMGPRRQDNTTNRIGSEACIRTHRVISPTDQSPQPSAGRRVYSSILQAKGHNPGPSPLFHATLYGGLQLSLGDTAETAGILDPPAVLLRNVTAARLFVPYAVGLEFGVSQRSKIADRLFEAQVEGKAALYRQLLDEEQVRLDKTNAASKPPWSQLNEAWIEAASRGEGSGQHSDASQETSNVQSSAEVGPSPYTASTQPKKNVDRCDHFQAEKEDTQSGSESVNSLNSREVVNNKAKKTVQLCSSRAVWLQENENKEDECSSIESYLQEGRPRNVWESSDSPKSQVHAIPTYAALAIALRSLTMGSVSAGNGAGVTFLWQRLIAKWSAIGNTAATWPAAVRDFERTAQQARIMRLYYCAIASRVRKTKAIETKWGPRMGGTTVVACRARLNAVNDRLHYKPIADARKRRQKRAELIETAASEGLVGGGTQVSGREFTARFYYAAWASQMRYRGLLEQSHSAYTMKNPVLKLALSAKLKALPTIIEMIDPVCAIGIANVSGAVAFRSHSAEWESSVRMSRGDHRSGGDAVLTAILELCDSELQRLDLLDTANGLHAIQDQPFPVFTNIHTTKTLVSKTVQDAVASHLRQLSRSWPHKLRAMEPLMDFFWLATATAGVTGQFLFGHPTRRDLQILQHRCQEETFVRCQRAPDAQPAPLSTLVACRPKTRRRHSSRLKRSRFSLQVG
ncbi:Kelch-type beta propeller [Diplonema papillatum]|nr:Kelch-type beta propeller [Diplonema papillatum]